jgi:hypothetical protein
MESQRDWATHNIPMDKKPAVKACGPFLARVIPPIKAIGTIAHQGKKNWDKYPSTIKLIKRMVNFILFLVLAIMLFIKCPYAEGLNLFVGRGRHDLQFIVFAFCPLPDHIIVVGAARVAGLAARINAIGFKSGFT